MGCLGPERPGGGYVGCLGWSLAEEAEDMWAPGGVHGAGAGASPRWAPGGVLAASMALALARRWAPGGAHGAGGASPTAMPLTTLKDSPTAMPLTAAVSRDFADCNASDSGGVLGNGTPAAGPGMKRHRIGFCSASPLAASGERRGVQGCTPRQRDLERPRVAASRASGASTSAGGRLTEWQVCKILPAGAGTGGR